MVSGERPFVSYSQLTPGKTGSAKTDEIAPTNQMSRNPMTLRTRRVDRVFIDVDFSLPFDSYRNNWSRILWPNDPAQAGRGNGVRLPTDAQSRPCLQPDG